MKISKKIIAFLIFALSITSLRAAVYNVDISKEAFKNFNIPSNTVSNVEAVKHDATDALKFSTKDFPNDAKNRTVIIPIKLEKIAGKPFTIIMDAVLENFERSPNENNNNTGTRVYFKYVKDGQSVYFFANSESGTAVKTLSLPVNIIPEDVMSGELAVGYKNSKGTVYFKNIKIYTGKHANYWKPNLPNNFKCEYTNRLKQSNTMRGAMVSTRFVEKDLEDFKKWNGNLIRVSIGGSPADNRWTFGEKEEAIINSPDYFKEYDRWIDGCIIKWKQFLNKAQTLGIKVVVGLHSTPGFRYMNKDMRIFFEKKFADKFVDTWKKIATELNGHPAIWCYDLCNEPIQSRPSKRDYLKLQYQTARKIRAIDPDTPISVEGVNWANPIGFKHLAPLPLKDIIYQVHFYYPGDLTHQLNGANDSIFYPNPQKKPYTKEGMREHLKYVRQFQQKWNARIYVGEFSCIRWAKGADLWIKDAIDIFEEYGWDWSYHAFREWDGWSVEHTTEFGKREISKTDTPSKKVLLKAYSKNKF